MKTHEPPYCLILVKSPTTNISTDVRERSCCITIHSFRSTGVKYQVCNVLVVPADPTRKHLSKNILLVCYCMRPQCAA